MKLFNIEQIEGGSTFIARVEPSHKVFEGHFPEQPVVPGVCTMAMVKECCSELLSRPVRYDYVKEVKFLSAIVPSIHNELSVTVEIDEDMNLKSVVTHKEQVMMKLKAVII